MLENSFPPCFTFVSLAMPNRHVSTWVCQQVCKQSQGAIHLSITKRSAILANVRHIGATWRRVSREEARGKLTIVSNAKVEIIHLSGGLQDVRSVNDQEIQKRTDPEERWLGGGVIGSLGAHFEVARRWAMSKVRRRVRARRDASASDTPGDGAIRPRPDVMRHARGNGTKSR